MRQQRLLLDNITANFAIGKITSIMGANGAGKSTLLKTLLGEFTETNNNVRFHNRALGDYSLIELAKKRAYVSQHAKPAFSLDVFEYLLLQREIYGESNTNSQAIVQMAANTFGINRLLERDVALLSGGEAQLVEFTRAYLQLYEHRGLNGKCLLLDEPASALDVKQTSLLYRHLLHIRDSGVTVILVDHDINAMTEVADDILLLKRGRLLACGSKHNVFTKQNFNQCFDVNGSLTYLQNTHSTQPTNACKEHAVFHVPIVT
jgi:iron complex transport system ATP-binding protein